MNLRQKSFFVPVILAACLFHGKALFAGGPPIPSGDQSWYYAIGGADPVSILNPKGADRVLYAHASLNMNYSCGDFDIVASVKNSFMNVANDVKNMVMTTARGAIAALPLYVFQRALPGLYEMFQSYAADFRLNFANAVMTCEDFEREILAGNDPYAEMIQAAKATAWKIEMATGNDAVQAKKNVDDVAGGLGVPFPQIDKGQTAHAGGTGQPPLEPIRNTTAAGWNATLGRTPANNSPYNPPSGVNMRLTELFPTPQAAADYAVDVLGELRLRTCEGCSRSAVPGNGLGPKFEKHRQTVASELASLVGGTGTPQAADLQKVSAPGVAVSGRIIEALRLLPQDERAIMAGRLASEVAMARTIEEILAVRRMLIAGKRVPEVASNAGATQIIDDAVSELEREIDNLLFEQRVSKEIASNTAAAILARSDQLNAQSERIIRQARPAKTHLDTDGRFQ